MTTVKIAYGTATTVTLDADALANNTSYQATAIDNTVNLYDDYLLACEFNTASGSLGTNPAVTVYVAPLADGTNYTDGCSGTAGTFTAPATILSTPASVVGISTAATAAHVGGISIAALFGGVCPPKFALWVTNATGLALAGTSGQNIANLLTVTPITYTAA